MRCEEITGLCKDLKDHTDSCKERTRPENESSARSRAQQSETI